MTPPADGNAAADRRIDPDASSKRYVRGSSSATHSDVVSVKRVVSALPALGETSATPDDGGLLTTTVTAATPASGSSLAALKAKTYLRTRRGETAVAGRGETQRAYVAPATSAYGARTRSDASDVPKVEPTRLVRATAARSTLS